jgi:hypothetical protein
MASQVFLLTARFYTQACLLKKKAALVSDLIIALSKEIFPNVASRFNHANLIHSQVLIIFAYEHSESTATTNTTIRARFPNKPRIFSRPAGFL